MSPRPALNSPWELRLVSCISNGYDRLPTINTIHYSNRGHTVKAYIRYLTVYITSLPDCQQKFPNGVSPSVFHHQHSAIRLQLLLKTII